MAMARYSRIFRVFVSSTFSDLKAEREALQGHVFPKLRDLCFQHNCRFQAIDLRWGVSEEAALDQQTMNICLEELRRCQLTTPRPNFIILLGQRYGWRPSPSQIPAQEFQKLERRITDENDRRFLAQWYERDDNLVPPQYRLKQRTGTYEKTGRWAHTERRLRYLLAQSARGSALKKDARIKYESAATHQEIEIGALKAEHPARQVFAFFRTIEGLPRNQASKNFLDLDEDRRPDLEAQRRLRRLKADLRRIIPRNVTEYSARWTNGGVDASYLKQLCADVYERLSGAIRTEIEGFEKIDPVEDEIAANSAFASERARFFTGRVDMLREVAAYIAGNDPHPLAVHGLGGSGKSALLAKIAGDCRLQFPNYRQMVRFVGATPASSDIRTLLENACRQIRRDYGQDEGVPSEYKELIDMFKQTLELATAERPLVLFIDAVDQLSDADRGGNLIWLPIELPDHVRIVVSTSPGECLSILKKRLPANNLVELQPMAPAEGAELLDHWLKEAHRRLQPAQRRAVLTRFRRYGLPLYLKLAFEETKTWKSSTDRDNFLLPADTSGMIRRLFRRLSLEANHGQVFVSRGLGYIAAARHGLSEDELLDVLSRDPNVLADFRRRSPKSPEVTHLPVVVWSRLFSDLEPYLTFRQGDGVLLISFYHRQLAEEGAVRFLSDKGKIARHRALASYFAASWSEQRDRHALSELAFQQTNAGLWPDLERTLTDLSFAKAKCEAGATYDLVGDYNTAAAAANLPPAVGRRISEFARFIKAQAHVLVRRPQLTFQQAANEPGDNTPARAALQLLHSTSNSHGWLRWVNKPKSTSRCLMVLVGHLGDINGCELSPDGSRLVSAGRDRAIHVWDPATGTELLTLFGHQTPIATCAYSPDGTCVASGGYDGSLKLWDPQTGAELPPLPGHQNQIEFCTFSPDGKRLISAGNDNTLRVWDVPARQEIAVLPLGKVTAMACAFSRDGKRIVSGNQRGEIIVWDARTYKPIRKIRAHRAEVMGCFFSPNGQWLFTTSEDMTFKRWDAGLKRKPLVFSGHTATVWACCVSKQSGLIASVSGDKTIKLWNARTGRPLSTLTGHSDAVLTCAFISGGDRLVTSSWDGTIRIWDVSGFHFDDAERKPLERPIRKDRDKNVWLSCGFSPDGSKMVAGSEDDLRLWDAHTGSLLGSYGPHSDYVRNCDFSPNGRWLFSSAASDLYRWNVARGRLPKLLRDHEKLVSGCHISTDGKKILSAAEDGTLRLWDASGSKASSVVVRDEAALTSSAPSPDWKWAAAGTKDGRLRFASLPEGKDLGEVKAHAGEITTIAIRHSDSLVATGSMDGLVKLWNAATHSQTGVISGHSASILFCDFDPERGVLATISRDTTLKIWDVATGELQRTLVGHATAFQKFRYSPDGARILSCSYDGTLRLWNPQSGSELAMLSGFRNCVVSGAFSPDGRRFVSASFYRTLKVIDAETGEETHVLEGHDAEVRASLFSPDGRRIVSASADGTLRIWNAATGKCMATLHGHTGPVHCCTFSPDGKFIVSGSWDRTLTAWDAQTGKKLKTFSGHQDWVQRVVFSPDGGRLISSSLDGTIRIWNTASGTARAKRLGDSDSVGAVAFSNDGTHCLSGGGDGTLRLWDVGTMRDHLRLSGHGAAVRSCAFAPNGEWAASASMDRTVRLWNLHNGEGVMLGQHESWLHCCAFSPDGARLASAGNDGLVKLWNVSERRLESEYWVGAPVRLLCWHPSRQNFIAGDEEGRVHVLALERAG
jgi:WD40 repeat protein